MSEHFQPEPEFKVLDNGQIQCNWKGCGKLFDGDPAGLKAFATHYHDHRKKGQEPKDEGLDLGSMKALLEAKERYQEAEAKAVKKTIDQILEERDKLYEVYIPNLDCKIQYGRLTVPEFMEIEHLTQDEFPRRFLYLMWTKGDPSLTEEKFNRFSDLEIRIILGYILENTPFLLPAPGRSALSETKTSKPSSQ